jgi:hypothetical protein
MNIPVGVKSSERDGIEHASGAASVQRDNTLVQWGLRPARQWPRVSRVATQFAPYQRSCAERKLCTKNKQYVSMDLDCP